MNEIGFARNHILTLFAYFGISKQDAAAVLLALEKVDTNFSQTIDVRAFATYYCGKHADCFVAIWDHYKPTLTSLRDELVSRANTASTATSIPYFSFITFLLFVFPTDYKELTKVFYWLVIFHPKKQITLDFLQNLSVAFESTKVTSSAHFEATKTSRMKKIRNALTFANLTDLTVEQFQAYDDRLWGVWLKPVRKMVYKFQCKFLGYKFWMRVRAVIAVVKKDYKGRLDKLQDVVDRNYWEEGKTITGSARDNGERKEARKKIRKFVRVLMDFDKLQTARKILNQNDEDIETVRQRGTMLHWLSRALTCFSAMNVSAQIEPAPFSSSTKSGTDGSSNKVKGQEQVTPIPMDVKYKSVLDVPLDVLFDQADDALIRGRAILNEELDVDEKFSDDEENEIENDRLEEGKDFEELGSEPGTRDESKSKSRKSKSYEHDKEEDVVEMNLLANSDADDVS